MTAKEIFLELLKEDGKPERLLDQYEALCLWRSDPVNGYLRNGRARGTTRKDRWGVTISWPEDHPGQLPITTPELKVIKDVSRWRDFVHVPDIAANCLDGWEECAVEAHKACGEERLLCAFSGTGLFEQCHFLMGFEDTLTNLYEHPREMHELIDTICEFKLGIIKLTCEKMHPDAVFFHDDWGTKTSLFMKPEMWREFFKEPYRKIYGYIRSQGLITIHHADSFCAPIVEDMAEIGIQCWQGVLPENDIPALQARLKGKLILMGGIGAAIDRPDSTEEEIRTYVRKTLEICAPGGHYIPSITYGGPGTIFKHVDPIIDDEIRKYNAAPHLLKLNTVRLPRRTTRTAAATGKASESVEADVLAGISRALCKGQRKRVMELVNTALQDGKTADDILNKGLIAGMNTLGDDFSAGRAFVPEMLIAAKCMSQAMETLKPLLQEGSGHAKGKAVIGTVKGDLHDIGKNIVKLAFEGCGIEVIDLGVDAAAELFVETAKRENCQIIACSSLLTTSMQEMANVVALANKEGIREKVIIMIGGAPTSQAFCDRIGADIYTPDAASAARKAVEALEKRAS